jgi:hypothetical protein
MAYTKTNWQDTPSIATPINATNLNKIETGLFDQDARITVVEGAATTLDLRVDQNEIYVTATATTNGDYKVTLTNTTLTTNRIIHIQFPSATDGTKIARLSIDNGNNYYTINLIASFIEGTRQKLLFNGTDFELCNFLQYVRANGSSDVTNAGTGALPTDGTIIPITSNVTRGNKLSVSSNKIVVGAGIKLVRVTAQAY